jgi:RNA polymerase sigma-70 factor (ECF subfamily)
MSVASLHVFIRDPLPWDRLLVSELSERQQVTVSVDPDGDWVRRARNGDAAAFRVLVDRYRHRALEIALRILRSPEEAEEAAQDAFVRAWKALDGFRGEARFSTWLYRIVTRCALDGVRRRRRHTEHETALEPETLESLPDPAGRPGDAPRLERLLDELDAVPRAVIALFYLRDRSVNEIAEILDLPAGTVKTHLHRSRAALRAAWLRHEARP